MDAHELVHVIQQYKKPGPGWLTEGVADYVRYYVIEPGSPRARYDVERSSYKSGYQPAAGLLEHVEKKHPGTAAKLNAALREGKYADDMIKEITGADWDALWDQMRESKRANQATQSSASNGRRPLRLDCSNAPIRPRPLQGTP